ncbi:BRO family protein [Streptomyces sp. NPDC001982]|uniref:phage antirepressor n=1 Tax=Streptomyces sp. NPDC001982 TaxID=3154405 RepID=UPI00332E14BA
MSISDTQPAVHTFPDTGHAVRTVIRDGEPWWVAADVCSVLGYSRVADALRIPDHDDLGTHFVRGQDGRERPTQLINEPGLYSLVFRSHRPEARAFKRWVTHEVLPAIRRTGRYEIARPEPTKLELARDLVAALEARETAEQRAAELEPSASAWDTLVAEVVGDYSVREAAQLLSRDVCIRTGQNRLFATLRELGWIDASGEPYQREVDAGRLVRRTTSYSHPHTGEPRLSWQVRVTPKGLAVLRDRLGLPRNLAPAAPAA